MQSRFFQEDEAQLEEIKLNRSESRSSEAGHQEEIPLSERFRQFFLVPPPPPPQNKKTVSMRCTREGPLCASSCSPCGLQRCLTLAPSFPFQRSLAYLMLVGCSSGICYC